MRLTVAFVALASPLAIYLLVVRPRLKARLTDLYADAGGFWPRLRARLYAFRTLAAYAAGCVALAAPEILAALAGVDFSFLPQPWPGYVGFLLATALALIRAYSTAPREEPPR
jgi:hypothetical protein